MNLTVNVSGYCPTIQSQRTITVVYLPVTSPNYDPSMCVKGYFICSDASSGNCLYEKSCPVFKEAP